MESQEYSATIGGVVYNVTASIGSGVPNPTGWFSVKAYGATGDGVTDDTTAIQSCLTAASAAAPCRVYFPAGTYIISSQITLTGDDMTLFGDGHGSVIYMNSVGSGKHAFLSKGDGCAFEDLKIESPTQTGSENAAIRFVKDDSSVISDCRVLRCRLEKFSYGVACTNGTRLYVQDNYFYSTGDDSTDTGGAVQLSYANDCHIDGNTFDGDPSNRFQHGVYAASQANGLWVENNTFRNGYYSYAVHAYLHDDTSDGIYVIDNRIYDCEYGVLVSDTAGDTNTIKNVVISNNNSECDARGVILSATVLDNIRITDNYFKAGTTAKGLIEVIQSAGDELTDLTIRGNIFEGWLSGTYAVDLNNAQDISRVVISENTFKSGTSVNPIGLDAATSTAYDEIKIVDNVADSATTWTSEYTNHLGASWLHMRDNSWDARDRGTGSPEGVVTANIGSLYRRTDGGAGTALYIKESGTGNTGWIPLSSGSATLAQSWSLPGNSTAAGTHYCGGYYDFGATDNNFSSPVSFGTANGAYGAHFFVVAASGATDTEITVTGTSITDAGTRTTGDTETLQLTDGAAGAYFETSKKWIGQVSVSKTAGTNRLCNYGWSKYWDNLNTDFTIVGGEAVWSAGKTDATFDIIVYHHKTTGWTYNAGSTPTPPTPLYQLSGGSGYSTEHSTVANEPGAWKRTGLSQAVEGSGSEGVIFAVVTGSTNVIDSGTITMNYTVG